MNEISTEKKSITIYYMYLSEIYISSKYNLCLHVNYEHVTGHAGP